MKKLIVLFACLFAVHTTMMADDDKPIQMNQLPQKAQQFIKQHFPASKVSLAKMESDMFDKSYDVIFTNGDKVEFNKKGEWKDIDCKYNAVPLNIVPAPIMKYVKDNHAELKIIKIDRDKRDYEVKLSNGLELKFDLKYKLINIDN